MARLSSKGRSQPVRQVALVFSKTRLQVA
jgi:hypothetical protein